MAVLVQLPVMPATRAQFDELDDRVGQLMQAGGGPPDGLMSHAVYPERDGFVISQVWRTSTEGESYTESALRPLITELGLTAGTTVVLPIWSYARP